MNIWNRIKAFFAGDAAIDGEVKKPEPALRVQSTIEPLRSTAVNEELTAAVEKRNQEMEPVLKRLTARQMYMKHHGDIPKGYVVYHKDGNKKNFAISNIACCSRAEHLKNNLQKKK